MAILNLVFDGSVNSAPAGFTDALNTAAQIVGSQIQDPISITINVGYGEINGVPITGNTLAEGSASGLFVPYGQLVSDLQNSSNTSQDYQNFLANLPATDPSNGGQFLLSNAEAYALGASFTPANGLPDGYAGFSDLFSYSYDQSNIASGTYNLVGIGEHELTHALGRIAPPGYLTPFDLASYDPNSGLLDINNGPVDRYFSIDGGQTNLAGINGSSDPADLSGSDGNGNPINDPFNAFISSGVAYQWTALDSQIMGTLGFNVLPNGGSCSGPCSDPAGNAAITPASLASDTRQAFLRPASDRGGNASLPAADPVNALPLAADVAQSGMPASLDLSDLASLPATSGFHRGIDGGSVDRPQYHAAGAAMADPHGWGFAAADHG
jgi:hypothetical protein